MRRSTERILTTHAGSLIRPAPLLQFIGARQRRQPYDEQAYQDCLRKSVSEIVGRQASIGIDAPSDGEFGKSIRDRKSTRLNSSHSQISYAVFCLKKKKKKKTK